MSEPQFLGEVESWGTRATTTFTPEFDSDKPQPHIGDILIGSITFGQDTMFPPVVQWPAGWTTLELLTTAYKRLGKEDFPLSVTITHSPSDHVHAFFLFACSVDPRSDDESLIWSREEPADESVTWSREEWS